VISATAGGRRRAHLTPMNSNIDEITLQPPQTTNTALERTKRLTVSNLSRGRSVLGNSKPSSAPHTTTCDVLPEGDALAMTWVMRSFAKIATAVSLALVRVLLYFPPARVAI
jgi:hypothetical protein